MSDKVVALFMVIHGAIFGFALGSMMGMREARHARHSEQQRAIEAGVGKWVIDAQTGERRFEYGK